MYDNLQSSGDLIGQEAPPCFSSTFGDEVDREYALLCFSSTLAKEEAQYSKIFDASIHFGQTLAVEGAATEEATILLLGSISDTIESRTQAVEVTQKILGFFGETKFSDSLNERSVLDTFVGIYTTSVKIKDEVKKCAQRKMSIGDVNELMRELSCDINRTKSEYTEEKNGVWVIDVIKKALLFSTDYTPADIDELIATSIKFYQMHD